jgi:hypothetical protein
MKIDNINTSYLSHIINIITKNYFICFIPLSLHQVSFFFYYYYYYFMAEIIFLLIFSC